MSEGASVVYSDRYQLSHRIGRGGMAEVHLAQDLLLARPVAIKVLSPEFAADPSFVARFRREAQAAANLTHPNVVGVYDWGQEDSTYFIVMEYVDGRSVAELLRQDGPLPAERAAATAYDVAAALGFAHRNGVVHRDVKPGNVLLSKTGQVKVADFGIARAIASGADENLTQTGSVMGTATYFSPEQAQGRAVDPRSDLYSLGVVMYEMVAGEPPFAGDNPISVAYRHVQEQPVPLRERAPAVAAGYEAITLKLLAKSPGNRYPNAESLQADLERFDRGEAVDARPPLAVGAESGTQVLAPTGAIGYPPEEPSRRTGAFVVVLVLLLALLGLLLFLFVRSLDDDDDPPATTTSTTTTSTSAPTTEPTTTTPAPTTASTTTTTAPTTTSTTSTTTTTTTTAPTTTSSTTSTTSTSSIPEVPPAE